MKILRSAVLGVMVVGCLSVPAAAWAATQYPVEGGEWNYGLTPIDAYSDYFHGDRCHGSSVVNDWNTNRSIDVAPGYWANARTGATPWTHNKYYYRVC